MCTILHVEIDTISHANKFRITIIFVQNIKT